MAMDQFYKLRNGCLFFFLQLDLSYLASAIQEAAKAFHVYGCIDNIPESYHIYLLSSPHQRCAHVSCMSPTKFIHLKKKKKEEKLK